MELIFADARRTGGAEDIPRPSCGAADVDVGLGDVRGVVRQGVARLMPGRRKPAAGGARIPEDVVPLCESHASIGSDDGNRPGIAQGGIGASSVPAGYSSQLRCI